ncbi:penicillin acylase family protein [Parageobacillus sp. VR-IP]|nr:penicillin acylase family protein [Parageobacillus sp. VR-IP]
MDKLFEGKQMVVDELLRRAEIGDVSPWFTENGRFAHVFATALYHVTDQLAGKYGDDPSKWKWRDYHQLYFAHPMSSSFPVLQFFFNREKTVSVGGSQVTVQAASFTDEGIVSHGASWRFVIDVNDMKHGYHIVSPGQAGHLRSRWYHDQIDDWVKGTYHVTTLGKVEGGDIF